MLPNFLFYLATSYRRNRIGINFAKDIISKYKGSWQIKQIQRAEYATKFLKKVIDWDRITKQLLCHLNSNINLIYIINHL